MLTTALHFNDGKCEDALKFYLEIFNTKDTGIHRYGDMQQGDNLSVEHKKYIAHSEITVYGQKLMLSDCYPGESISIGENFSLSINTTDLAELERVYNKLSQTANIIMPLAATEWSKAYAMIKDKFGIIWQFNLD